MKTIKGFVTISQLIDNNINTISPLGEISTQALTYSKNKGEYLNIDVPGYSFISFTCKDVNTGVESSVSSNQVNQIIEMASQAFVYCSTNIRPYNSEDFRDTLLSNLIGHVSDIEFGAFVENDDFGLPEWLSWKNVDSGNDIVKIWLANNSFIEQYDEYSIVVIPPLVNLNSLFGSYSAASSTMQSRTMPQLTDIIQDARNDHPESYLRSFNFLYYNKDNLAQSITTTWTTIIYGKAGDNVDSIKDAIVEYVLDNSTHERDEWEIIFPDIMKRTEFIILPRWDLMSIPNLTLSSGLYSSIVDPAECIQFAKDNISFYTDEFVGTNVNILPYDYKTIMLLIVNGFSNAVGKDKLNLLFPDYLPVPSLDADFNKMTPYTRDWSLLISELLIISESATRFTTVPSNYRRVERDGVVYISKLYDNVNYLMAVKSNTFYDE